MAIARSVEDRVQVGPDLFRSDAFILQDIQECFDAERIEEDALPRHEMGDGPYDDRLSRMGPRS